MLFDRLLLFDPLMLFDPGLTAYWKGSLCAGFDCLMLFDPGSTAYWKGSLCAEKCVASTDSLRSYKDCQMFTESTHSSRYHSLSFSLTSYLIVYVYLSALQVIWLFMFMFQLALQVACLQFVNALLSQPDDLDFRLHLRNEFMRTGLNDTLVVSHTQISL